MKMPDWRDYPPDLTEYHLTFRRWQDANIQSQENKLIRQLLNEHFPNIAFDDSITIAVKDLGLILAKVWQDGKED